MRKKKSLDELARTMAALTGDDDGGPLSLGFARVLLYTCMLYGNLYKCQAGGHCRDCLAQRHLAISLAAHPRLEQEIAMRDALLGIDVKMEPDLDGLRKWQAKEA